MSVFFPPITGRVEFTPDTYESWHGAEFQLLGLEAYFANTEAFVEEMKAEAQIDMATRFESETDPDGVAWLPLIDPAPQQIGILQLTGQMREDAISDEAWVTTPEGLFFDTSVLPDYWIYHEQPEGEGAQRISRRQFIGLSDQTERKIENRFQERVDEGLLLGGVFRREVRNMLGQFTPLA